MRIAPWAMALLALPAAAQEGGARQVILDVQWPSTSALRGRNSLEALRLENVSSSQAGELADRFSAVRLPVLLPVIEGQGTHIDAKIEALSYVVSYDVPRGHIEVLGTRKAITAPLRDTQFASQAVAAEPLHDEVGVSIPISRYGVSYSVSVYCDQPEQDSRCSGDNYIRKLASGMSMVGGRPETGNER